MLRFQRTCASGVTLTLLTALALPAAADQVTLEPTKDGTLYQPFEDKANGAGDHLFVGNTGGGDSRRAVIAFDVSTIQAGSTIDSVTLTLNLSRTIAGSAPDPGSRGALRRGRRRPGDGANLRSRIT